MGLYSTAPWHLVAKKGLRYAQGKRLRFDEGQKEDFQEGTVFYPEDEKSQEAKITAS